MPPKRAKKEVKSSSVDEEEEKPTKKAKMDAVSGSAATDDDDDVKKVNKVDQAKGNEDEEEESDDSEEDDDKPECMYGVNCYRKNPQHFKEFSHPHLSKKKQKKKEKEKEKKKEEKQKDKDSEQKNDSPKNPPPKHSTDDKTSKKEDAKTSSKIEEYMVILKLFLKNHKISPENKRTLRNHRKENDISNEEHLAALSRLGWTEEEYDDGEKRDDDVDLEDEREILKDENGFKIITIKKEDSNKSKEKLHTFSKVCTMFYETMSKAQANFSVSAVGVVVNTKTKTNYQSKKMELELKGKQRNEPVEEIWGFHGTSSDSIQKICATNFLHPDDLKKNSKSKKGGKHKMKDKPVELLDDGYFGKGIYFTLFSDYALWYSEERDSDQVLLCKLLPGKSFKCYKRMDGQGLQKGFDSHTSPKGNEVVIFNPHQILPRYVVTFVEKEAEEREQES